jgi:hypothetical protein
MQFSDHDNKHGQTIFHPPMNWSENDTTVDKSTSYAIQANKILTVDLVASSEQRGSNPTTGRVQALYACGRAIECAKYGHSGVKLVHAGGAVSGWLTVVQA